MVDPSIYTDYYKRVKSCSQAAQHEFAKIWAMLDLGDVESSKKLLLELLPGVVSKYGDAAATAAAEMYEAVCLAEVGKTVTAELAEPSAKKVRRSVFYAASIMSEGDFHKAFSVLRTATDYYVKKPARDTVENSAKRDGARFARVPQGLKTCDFCVMLASRGFVYHSKASAKGEHGYHTDCDCMPVPSFKAGSVVPGYDPKYYEKLYSEMEDKGKWNRAREEKVKEGIIDKAGGPSKGGKAKEKQPSKAFRGKFSSLRDMGDYLEGAKSLDELMERGQEIEKVFKHLYGSQQKSLQAIMQRRKKELG